MTKAYPAYKDSGVEWLADLPYGWAVGKFRHQFRESPEKIDSEVVGPMLSVSGYRGIEVKGYDDENRRRLDEDLVGYRIVRPGQLVVNTMWLNYAGLGVSEFEGHVSPAYRSYDFRQDVDRRYFHHLLRSSIYVQGYTQLLTGIRPNSLQMSREDLMDFPVVLPPLPEQTAIAAFLDRETAKIDALVAEQRRLIDLLREKRQAVISHAVTKGLNPNAPLKPSGIDWLGDVPEGWEVCEAKRFVSILSGFAFPSTSFSDDEHDTPLLRGANVGVGELRWDETVYWRRAPDDGLDVFEVQSGDLVIGMDRPWISAGVRVAIVTENDVPCLLLQRVASLRTDDSLNKEFLRLQLSGEAFIHHFLPDMTGVSVPHISPSQIGSFVIVVPPRAEQDQIIAHLADKTSQLDTLNATAETAIALLQERRAALISAAVTGKIDVRHIAPKETEAA
ncbi:MAG: hypothetical protein U0934_15160 [Pseudotabrizicola sp.]|uniref:restriction endonuclease subunit S n=1 Tax=Pseudotabrizicola sp. TaxID=2939647 RepID=UPI002730F167|nr:hypothetical protein [Pseudotabrizicola sp.]MDP2081383.1 hypothetical protein [Pseudotabrizicola sp.]MDZ7575268.1 hypothetical protein [Pseudotabrizicola sp.]